MEDTDVCSIQDFDPGAGTGILVVVGVPDAEVKQPFKSDYNFLPPACLNTKRTGTMS